MREGASPLFAIFRHELRVQLRSPLFWVGGALLFVIAFLTVSIDSVAADLGRAVGGVYRNAPYVVIRSLLQLSMLGGFVATAFVAGTVVRDYERGMHEIFFSLPITKREYVLGRFSGAFVAALLLFVFAMAAFAMGGAMPWIPPDRLGPFRVGPYLFSFLLIIVPNLLVFSAIVFATATATRSMMYSYVSVIALIVAYSVSSNLLGDMASRGVASLLDPFGWGPFSNATRYWTTAERNGGVLSLVGPFLWNRLLWLTIGLGVLAAAYVRFSFSLHDGGARRPGGPEDRPEPRWGLGRWTRQRHAVQASFAATDPSSMSWRLPSVSRSFTPATHALQLLRVAGRETRRVLTGVPFLVILALGLLNFTSNARALEQFLGGMSPLPVTRLMLEAVTYFSLYVWIILAVYAAELPWRERLARMDELADALPAPLWVRWGGKLAALLAIVGAVLLLAMGIGVATQLSHGYTHLEPGLYLRGFFLFTGLPIVHFAILALFVQVMVDHRYAGYFGLLGVALTYALLTRLGVDHPLLWPPTAIVPGVEYSDMNGFGPFVQPIVWFYLYWSLASVLLLVLVHLFWPRGTRSGLRDRLALARRRWTPRVRAVAGATAALFLGVGSWIFYNTNVLNEYVSPRRVAAVQARYEEEYARYETLPQPKITAVQADVDIFPHRHALEVHGTYRLRNETGEAIPAVHVTVIPWLDSAEVRIAGATTTLRDSDLGYSIHTLDHPLEPGDELEMVFDVAVEHRGFVARGLDLGPYISPFNTHLVENGSFVRSALYLPTIGYLKALEVQNAGQRRRLGLTELEPLPPADDAAARNQMFADANWIDFESVVSTSADQVALAPGELVGEWRQDGRRFFRYRARHPMEPDWNYFSGSWAVAHDRWKDVDIAVYHYSGHPFNVRRMLDAAKASLEIYDRTFGPYPERVLRIVEFPRYARFGESHATQVLISESSGFIADAERSDAPVDYVSMVVEHEVAHEWWGNSLIAANTRGRGMVIESLAEYSALMVNRHRFGDAAARRYLRYALDLYFRLRAAATTPERPLVDAEDDQQYVIYPKGALALNALADQFGEAALNAVLRRFYADNVFGEAPFPTSLELLGYLEEIVPPDRRGLLEDWFETVTLWELRARDARASRRGDGKYVVDIDIEAGKRRVDEAGEERAIPIDDWIDIGVFGQPGGDRTDPPVLYLEKHRITAADTTLEIVVDQPPASAGIDPFNKLIDRNPDNNVTALRNGRLR